MEFPNSQSFKVKIKTVQKLSGEQVEFAMWDGTTENHMILFDTLNHVILRSLPSPHIVLWITCGILLFPIEDSRNDNNSINWIRIEKISSNFFFSIDNRTDYGTGNIWDLIILYSHEGRNVLSNLKRGGIRIILDCILLHVKRSNWLWTCLYSE